MKTRTAGGTAVILTAKLDDNGNPTVAAAVKGMTIELQGWTTEGGREGAYGYRGTQIVALPIPRADYDAILAEAQQMAILSEDTLVEATYRDSDTLSGYTVHDHRIGQRLLDIGIAQDVDGWGIVIDSAAVDALGERFSLAAAAEYGAKHVAAAPDTDAAAEADAVRAHMATRNGPNADAADNQV